MSAVDLNDYDYHLPKELIAQEPVRPRDASRLLVVKGNELRHLVFKNILDYFNSGDVLVLNNTKVMANKLRGEKSTGADTSIVIQEKTGETYKAKVNSRNPKPGNTLIFPEGLTCEIIGKEDDVFFLRFNKDPEEVLQKYGELPPPDYVRKRLAKDEHYQTEFSSKKGSLAAPTSGLHFTKELLEKLKNKGVKICFITLHISFGTFKMIDETKPVEDNKTEKEYYEIPFETIETVKKRTGKLILCGTTVFKALESCAREGMKPGKNHSDLFICPGHEFIIKPDMMITNFHLPKSSLLLFISAYFGKDVVLNAYNKAVEKEYRFFSLGDACLFIRQ